jgi:D-alanyl-D-alanine carboxypeptidase
MATRSIRYPMVVASLIAVVSVVAAGCASTTQPAANATTPASTATTNSTTSIAPPTTTNSVPPTTATRTTTTTVTTAPSPLSAERLQAIIDAVPAALHVPGVAVAVSVGDQSPWVGAAGIEDTATGTPMRTDRRFRMASITKLFTARVIFERIDRGELHLNDRLATWFPNFPNADKITIQMLLSHTGGITTDWWLDPDILKLATTNLERAWTPDEVITELAKRPPAGPPGGPVLYSNIDFILLGEIAAKIGAAPIGTLIEQRILQPLHLDHTTYQNDNAPELAHAYNSFTGQTLDVGALQLRSFLSMAGAAGTMQTDITDLTKYVRALLGTPGLVQPEIRTLMETTTPTSGRHGLASMGFCPCHESANGRSYGGWGHTGSIPGFFSAAAYFRDSDITVVAYVNSDTRDGALLNDDALDVTIEQLVNTIAR